MKVLPLPADGYTFNMLVVDVMVQFYPCFNFNFLLFLGMVMYDNEFETKENGNTPGGRSSCGGLLRTSMVYTGKFRPKGAPWVC